MESTHGHVHVYCRRVISNVFLHVSKRTPLIPTEFCAEDSFSFVNEIQKLSMHNKFMVWFDVESLFTNIPLEESIDLAVSYINQYTNTTFSAKELKDIFHIATA